MAAWTNLDTCQTVRVRCSLPQRTLSVLGARVQVPRNTSPVRPRTLPAAWFPLAVAAGRMEWCMGQELTPRRQTSARPGSGEPGVATSVLTCVVRIQINEDSLNQEVSNLEDIAPAARTVLR